MPDDADPTLLSRAVETERADLGYRDADADGETVIQTGDIAARSTTIGGQEVDLAEPRTQITFEDEAGLLSGEYGRPRPREFWTAKQLGKTPPMEVLKNAVARQLTGGDPKTEADEGQLQGPVSDFADLVVDIYRGPHFQRKSLDNIIVDAISDMLDYGWAYWEFLPSQNGEFPVAAFKPLPPLQIQHNLTEDGGDFVKDPAYYHVPYKQRSGTVEITTDDPTGLREDEVVAMRYSLATNSDSIYGQSLATKVREWLEIIIDVDVHQKRHYSDSQLPAGLLHFAGNVGDDKLQEVEQQLAEASGDPHDLVTASSDGQANWVPMGPEVVDLDAIQEQQWYFKLVYAAAGLNLNELGVIEGSGFAKETPAMQRAIYKNLTKPMMNAIFDPQNNHVIPTMADAVGLDAVPFRLTLERFDPVQEQIEREETQSVWSNKGISLNEYRGALGREAVDIEMELGGQEVNIGDLPRYVVDLLKQREQAELTGEMPADDGTPAGETETYDIDAEWLGENELESDPVLSLAEAGDLLGIDDPWGLQRRLDRNTKQLEDTIEIQSSFLVSTAYDRVSNMMQLEFEKEGSNATYWYGGVPETGAASFFGFLRASSKGSYFNAKIRHTGQPGYPYVRVE